MLGSTSQVCFHAFSVKSEQGIALDLKSQIAISKKINFFLSILKKIHSMKSPTIPPSLLPTFPFLPPPYNFVLISPSSLVFWTISPFSLFWSSPLLCSSPIFLMLRYLRHLWLFLLSMEWLIPKTEPWKRIPVVTFLMSLLFGTEFDLCHLLHKKW